MKKVTKGTIAAGAAVALLIGAGGGTLAYWNDAAGDVDAEITAGHLDLNDAGTPAWQVKHGNLDPVDITDPTAVHVVPGDQLIYTGAFTITSRGEGLTFTVKVADGSVAAASADANDTALAAALAGKLGTSFTVDGEAPTNGVATVAAEGDDEETHDVHVTATLVLPFGTEADNAAQDGAVNLTGFTVEATQVAPAARQG